MNKIIIPQDIVTRYSFIDYSKPIVGIILGLIVWKSRSIATSMITHNLVNSLGLIIEKLY